MQPTDATPSIPPPPTPPYAVVVRYLTAALQGIGQWLGEAVVGLIPLIVYFAVHRFSNLPITALCPKQTPNSYNNTMAGCTALVDNPSQEVCILAVVISGLAVLSVVPLGRHKRQITGWTRLLILFAVLSLIFGSLFYAFFTAHMDRDADTVTYYILTAALVSSFCLSIEGAILDA
jgi:hypothetical protein